MTLQGAELVRDFVAVWPMMRPLVLVLKLFLQQRELNEVYTGERPWPREHSISMSELLSIEEGVVPC